MVLGGTLQDAFDSLMHTLMQRLNIARKQDISNHQNLECATFLAEESDSHEAASGVCKMPCVPKWSHALAEADIFNKLVSQELQLEEYKKAQEAKEEAAIALLAKKEATTQEEEIALGINAKVAIVDKGPLVWNMVEKSEAQGKWEADERHPIPYEDWKGHNLDDNSARSDPKVH